MITMTEQELDKYLEDNLSIDWSFDKRNCHWHLVLKLKGKTISKIPFEAN